MRRHLEAIEDPGTGRLVSASAFAQALKVLGRKTSATGARRPTFDELMKRAEKYPQLRAALAEMGGR